MDLSVLIPTRNEIWLAKTIEDILKNSQAETEIIAVCDGAWPDPPVNDHPRVNLIYHSEPIGQRAATNEAARLSQAKFVMKCDAHCAFDKDFDTKLMTDCDYDWTVVPRMYTLHTYNWKCQSCGDETYQGPEPATCGKCKGDQFERVMVWQPNRSKKSDYMWFDTDMRFAYFDKNHLRDYGDDTHALKRKYDHKYREWGRGDITDQMCAIGACWMMHRERFWDLGGVDEKHGSWGQMGVEIACKSWLSGGRQMVNKKTWFAHLYRRSPDYKLSGRQVEGARDYSRKLWKGNSWPKAKHPLSWLIDRFSPLPGWDVKELKEGEGKWMNEMKKEDSQKSQLKPLIPDIQSATTAEKICQNAGILSVKNAPEHSAMNVPQKRQVKNTGTASIVQKSLVYYTDNHTGEDILLPCQRQLERCMQLYHLPIISVSQKPIDFGKNIVMDLERSVLSMYKQILRGLEESETDIIFMVEHDLLYHPSHFDFMPEERDKYYYDRNVWAVDADTGKAVFYHRNVPSLLCAYRELLIEHYRRKVEFVEANGFKSKYGFSPPKGLPKELRNGRYKVWFAEHPSIDIRHSKSLTRRRMDKSQFRSERSCRGWTEADGVPSWGKTKGCFDKFLQEVPSKQFNIQEEV